LTSRYTQTPQFIEAVVMRRKASDGKTAREPQVTIELRREQIVVASWKPANLLPVWRTGRAARIAH
jgi:hypothetical protein